MLLFPLVDRQCYSLEATSKAAGGIDSAVMRIALRFFAILLVLATLLAPVVAQNATHFTSPLPTGVRLDPAGEAIESGSLPINLVIAPEGDRAIVVLSGWREQGIQVVDLGARRVTQTLTQDAAFYGAVFAPDGSKLYVSGGNEDVIFVYSWSQGAATFERKIVLGQKTAEGTGSRYPAGLAISSKGEYLYVAENVGDRLAVVNTKTVEVAQRFPTDRYPYAVAASCGHVYVSAWGGSTLSQFEELPDGTLAYMGRIEVGRHPSALAVSACAKNIYVALAGSDQVAVVDRDLRRVTSRLHDAAPGAPNEGSTPNALALIDGRLLIAEGHNNAVAVFEHGRLAGRIPTDWYPTAVAQAGDELLVSPARGTARTRTRMGLSR